MQPLDTQSTQSTMMPIVLVVACWIGTISTIAFVLMPLK